MDNRNPLRSRLLLVGVCGIAVVAAFILVAAELAAWNIEPYEQDRVRTNAFRRLEHVRDRVLNAVGPPPGLTTNAILEANDQLQPFLQRVAAESNAYTYVMVISPNGTVLAHTEETAVATALLPDVFAQLTLADRMEPREVELDSWFAPGRIIDFAMPVVVDRQTLASVHLGVSQPKLAQQIAEQQAFIHKWFRLTIAVSVAVLCVAGVVAWRLVLRAGKADAAVQRRNHLAEVGELADGLVHEIRNPLNAMRIQLAIIRNQLKKLNGPYLAEATTQLEGLEGEVLRLQDLATDFLTLGKPNADHTQQFTLAELLRDVGDFLRPELEQHQICFGLDIESGARHETVTIDRGKLRQALLNIATNSEHAMPDGGTLSVSLTKLSQRDLQITIRDTGCGIPEDKLTRVFDPFFSTKDEGNGLGLSITKRIIEAGGGSIGITSEVGDGTTVEIKLPVAKPAKSGDTDRQPESKALEVNA